jgi:hypothetical protein
MTKNYRLLYEKVLDIKIPKGYVIHHIDLNRENNNFKNLVMLPQDLHTKYHAALEKFNRIKKDCAFEIELMSINGVGHNEYLMSCYKEFNEIYKMCCLWVDYKNYMLGIIPNIHNIEVDYGNL